MKLIQSSAYLKPFCHEGARYALLPSSNLFLKLYPTKIAFFTAEKNLELVEEWDFDIQGPFQNFTWEMDIAKKKLYLHFQKGKDSYYFIFFVQQGSIFVKMQRLPLKGLEVQTKKGKLFFKKKEVHPLHLEGIQVFFPSCKTRMPQLFLGCKKAQNLQKMLSKQDLSFWLPHYFQLSFFYSLSAYKQKPSDPDLHAYQALSSCEKNDSHQAFFNLLSHHFESYFFPSFNDPHCLRIFPLSKEKPPLSLYANLYPLLLSLFVDYQDSDLYLLPRLPPQLHTGKLIALQVNEAFSLSLYWSKKKIRQLEIYAHQAFTLTLHPGKEIKTYRMYSRSKKQAKSFSCGEVHSFSSQTRLYFDRFEK